MQRIKEGLRVEKKNSEGTSTLNNNLRKQVAEHEGLEDHPEDPCASENQEVQETDQRSLSVRL